ncbi:MAG: IS66 family transposase [Actinomycetales bacterium]|nr:IS66 family transposase [Actinomycetales bacterium]
MPSSSPGDSDRPSRERLEALLASGNTKAVTELFADLEARADSETARADSETARASEFVEQADALGETVRRLEFRVNHLARLLYGRRSEKLTKEELCQLVLAFGGEGGEDGEQGEPQVPAPSSPEDSGREDEAPEGDRPRKNPKKRRPNHPGRTKLSPELERRVHDVPVPDDERRCACCGEEMACIGHLEHERVEHVPAKFVVDIERREKLGCKNKNCRKDAVTAERATKPKHPTRVGASVLAHLIESKCDDALPLYRQCDQFSRLGFDIPLNTLFTYWNYALDTLFPIAEVTLGTVLSDSIVRIDDTGLPVVAKKIGKPDSKNENKLRGHLWCFKGVDSPMVAYQFTKTWEAAEIMPWIAAIDGFIQVDDYKGYASEVEGPDGERIKLVPDKRRLGCMMHVRRRFYDAFKLGDKRAGPALDLIRRIYKIEDVAKKTGLDADARFALRRSKSLPLLARFYAWVDEMKPKLGTTSKLAQAVRYANNQRSYIERCFTDGRFEIDNGEVERTLKEPCLGRKNFLHTGSLEGAKRLATAYTLVQSCRALGISTREYLIDVLDKIAGGWPMRRICELVPARWARDRGLRPASDQVAE